VLEVNDCSADDIVRGLNLLLGLPHFKPQQPEALLQALEWCSRGMDFADAIHLALRSTSEHLATFDIAFTRRAGKLRTVPQVVGV